MSNIVMFGSTVLKDMNKKGVCTPDEDGYYTINVGALNCFNSKGERYVLEGSKKLFEDSGPLMRRLDNGCLIAELGHPKRLPGMTDREFFVRQLQLFEDRECGHFKEIWLDYDAAKSMVGTDNDTVIIVAKIKPSGPFGKVLEDSITNPNKNTAFSIRSVTNRARVNGVIQKTLVNIRTFDLVNDPGIRTSTKWNSMATENDDFSVLTEDMLSEIAQVPSMVSNESDSSFLKEIKDQLTVTKRISSYDF